jgi:hypothetical protein
MMSRLKSFVECGLFLVAFASLVSLATNVQADQVVLEPASVIGGSGSWAGANDWDVGQFNATLVADNQTATTEIDEPDQSPGDDNGGFWLGKENDEEEFFVLDLGQQYNIQRIDIFNTHNAQFDDRATNGYEIYGSNSVGPNNDPDTGAGGDDLVNGVLIASGELAEQIGADDPIDAESIVPTNGGPFQYLRFQTVGPFHPGQVRTQRSVGINEILIFEGGGRALQAGDADQDLDFDQLDLVRVSIAGKYLSGQAATWGDGDWDGAPGGSPGSPPAGDRVFNQVDIIAALNAGKYLTGPYAALAGPGTRGDGQTSLVYNPSTGELAVDAPAGVNLTSINIDSAGGVFTGAPAQNLGGSFDNDADTNIFKATFGSSFGSLSFGNVAQAGLTQQFLLNDLTAVGSLAGGGALGNVDLIYVPEPSTMVLASFALLLLTGLSRRSRRR